MIKVINRVISNKDNRVAFVVSMFIASLLILAHLKGIINLTM